MRCTQQMNLDSTKDPKDQIYITTYNLPIPHQQTVSYKSLSTPLIPLRTSIKRSWMPDDNYIAIESRYESLPFKITKETEYCYSSSCRIIVRNFSQILELHKSSQVQIIRLMKSTGCGCNVTFAKLVPVFDKNF